MQALCHPEAKSPSPRLKWRDLNKQRLSQRNGQFPNILWVKPNTTSKVELGRYFRPLDKPKGLKLLSKYNIYNNNALPLRDR
jgi:hypothetical protein